MFMEVVEILLQLELEPETGIGLGAYHARTIGLCQLLERGLVS